MTKYPIILVHGIILKDIKFIKAFGKIEKHLNSLGNACYTSKTDGFGTISNNAEMLKNQIDQILLENNTTKVNLICHSKGGLDAKYLINELNYGSKIASYITLNTPHKGSILADKILTLPRFITKILSWYLNFIYKIFGDKKPDSYRVCLELTKEAQDNTLLLNRDNIFCMSFSSTMSKSKDDYLFTIPFKAFNYFEDDKNDGAVSLESQKYINYQGNIDNISHREITGFFVKKKNKEKVFKFYEYLAKELEKNNL